MNLKKIKKKMLKEKKEELLRYKVIEEYLVDAIEGGDKHKRPKLNDVRVLIRELEKQIEFFQK